MKKAFFPLVTILLTVGCNPTKCPCDPVNITDDPIDSTATSDACHRAGLQLAKLKCPEWRKDWDEFCRYEQDAGIPLCPEKLSKIKNCAEVDKVCR